MFQLLVIDDEKQLTSLIKAKLSEQGFAVDTFNASKGAFEHAKKNKPDVIVLDIMLGDGAGYEVARKIRRDPELYLIPILFVSTLGEQREVEYALSQGGDEYLVKPFSLEQILAKLSTLVALGKKLQSKQELTKLPPVERAKREIDYWLLRQENFVLCYLTIDEFDNYLKRKGKEKAESVIMFLAKLLADQLKASGKYEFHLSHLGSDHFLASLRGDDHHKLLHSLVHMFHDKLRDFYLPQEWEQGFFVNTGKQGVYKGHPLMELRICTLTSDFHKYPNAQAMLHKIRMMQDKSSSHDKEVIFSFRQKDKL